MAAGLVAEKGECSRLYCRCDWRGGARWFPIQRCALKANETLKQADFTIVFFELLFLEGKCNYVE